MTLSRKSLDRLNIICLVINMFFLFRGDLIAIVPIILSLIYLVLLLSLIYLVLLMDW